MPLVDAAPVPAAPVARADARRPADGFAFEVHLGSTLLAADKTTSINLVDGGFLAGWRFGRVIVGLTLDLTRSATSSSQRLGGVSTPDMSSSTTALLLGAATRVTLLRSRDERVELFGALELDWGHQLSDQSPADTSGTDTSNQRFVYRVGPGARYWLHPQFALGALAGLRGDFVFTSTTTRNGSSDTSSDRTTALTSIFAQLQLLAVF